MGELGHGLLDGWLAVRASRPGGDVGQAWPAIAGECWAKQAVRVRTRAGRQVGELGHLVLVLGQKEEWRAGLRCCCCCCVGQKQGGHVGLVRLVGPIRPIWPSPFFPISFTLFHFIYCLINSIINCLYAKLIKLRCGPTWVISKGH